MYHKFDMMEIFLVPISGSLAEHSRSAEDV
jgi:hypothetical protein